MNLFEKAAEILSEGGHCKHKLQEGTAHCANGALWAAKGWNSEAFSNGMTSEDTQEACNAATRAGNLLYERKATDAPGTLGLVHWNNAPERTGEDVILLFKELAQDAREAGE